MKISHLSRLSGVSVPTIKFYLREQLLPPGMPTARNQAEYDETHIARLRLIRLLTGVGAMSLAAVREVLAAVDRDSLSPFVLAQTVNRALVTDYPAPSGDSAAYAVASRHVDQFLTNVGWQVHMEAPEREGLAHVLVALEGLGIPGLVEEMESYVDAAERIACAELDRHESTGDATIMVAKVVLFEAAFAIMRRIAVSHQLALRADPTAMGPPPTASPEA